LEMAGDKTITSADPKPTLRVTDIGVSKRIARGPKTSIRRNS
jgi:hypothetical protein